MRKHQRRATARVPEHHQLGVGHVEARVTGVAVVVDDGRNFETTSLDFDDALPEHAIDVVFTLEGRDAAVVHAPNLRAHDPDRIPASLSRSPSRPGAPGAT